MRPGAGTPTLDQVIPWLQRNPARADALTGLVLGAALVAVTAMGFRANGVDPIAYPCCAVAGGAFALRRAMPVLTTALVAVALTVYGVTGQPGSPIYLAGFLAVANLAAVRPTRVWLPWSAASAVGLVGGYWIGHGFASHLLLVAILQLLIPKVTADATRARRLRVETLEARVDLAEQETLRRVAEERLRIAREVHDVVGHGLATITLRAGVADRVAERDPAEVTAALRAIRQISRESLAELSALLGMLRAEGEAERSPAPDLDALPRLVDGLREAGMDVELDVDDGDAEPVPEVVAAAGYRIVQEALTNVARHAGPHARARVRLKRRDGVVEVEIRDDGRGAPVAVAPGGGMTGMRERAAAVGGRFDAGGAPGGGFRVWASLPAVAR